MPSLVTDPGIIHYETYGRGRPVLLLHGWLGSWELWRNTIEVLGREFRYALLARLALDTSGLDEAIARLVDEGLLVPAGSANANALRFKHALIHDAVYRTLLRGDRQRLHARAAELLAGEFAGSADASPDQRAHHLAQAGRPVEAIGATESEWREVA